METIPNKAWAKKYQMLSRKTDADKFQAPATQYARQAHDTKQAIRNCLDFNM